MGPLLLLWVLSCGDDSKAGTETPEDTAALCANGADDDGDLAEDCADPDCFDFCAGDSDSDVDTDTDVDSDTDPPDPCEVIAQTGCEAGEACKLSWNDRKPSVACLPPGENAIGGTCATSTDCEGGLTCWESCRPACHIHGDCVSVPSGPYDGSQCIVVQLGWGYCSLPCDPFTPGSCTGGTTCVLIIDGDLPTTDCVGEPGDVGAGGDCTQPLDCAVGTACDNAAGGGFTCEAICDADDDCGGGTCRLLEGGAIGTCR